jgi:hypothetical protein
MRKKLVYWAFAVIFSLGIIVLVQILFRQYRVNNLGNLNHLGETEFIFTVIFLPIYLVLVYSLLKKNLNYIGSLTTYTLLVILCILVSSRMNYINWWDTEGQIINVKDAEARDVIGIFLLIQFFLGVVFSLLGLYIFKYRKLPI